MNVRSSSVIVACALLLSVASPAAAQVQPASNRKKALELYDRGKIQYDLGRWDQAIDLWMQAYETFDAPEFLFNIAQAYRHKGDCEQGPFFYRRYLSTKPNAPNRSEVDGYIADLERKCKDKPPVSGRGTSAGQPTGGQPTSGRGVPQPPDAEGGDTGNGSGTGAEGRDVADASDPGDEGETDEEGEVEDTVEPGADQARLFALRVAVGPSFPSLGNLDVGTLVSITGGVSHPLYFGQVVLEPGALVTYTPIPWEVENADPPRSGTAGLTGLMANLGAGMEFLPGLSGRAEAGLGALIFSGLTETGNPFLDMNDFADGPIALFHVRGALGVEYAITSNFLIHAEPVVFSFSPSRPLREDIESVTRFEMLVGVGYRM
jgi:hypothetical protein